MEPGGLDDLMIFNIGWGADYNDASNFINTLFSNSSTNTNGAQYNGYNASIEAGRNPMVLMDNVQLLMEAAVLETNPITRQLYYNRIQELLVEEDMPWAFLYTTLDNYAYRSHFLGYQSSPMGGGLRFFGVYQNTSKAPKNINIEGNQEWIYFKNSSRCTGNGTYSEPYVLKDLVIDGRNESVSCIRIKDSNVFFRIENCMLFNSTQAGIRLDHAGNGTLIDNNCSFNNKHGIFIDQSDNTTVSGNTANNNTMSGIYLGESNNNTLSGNLMNFCGIDLWGSLVGMASHSIDKTNLVNNKPVYYYVNEIGLGSSNFTDAGQIILINCNSSIILGFNLSNGTLGIYLCYSDNNTISGNIANNNRFGLYLFYSDNNTLSGNTANNNDYGIILYRSNNNTLSGNTASNNIYYGIRLVNSDNNTLSGNTASNNNNYGISLSSSANNNKIFLNNFFNNGFNAEDNGINNTWDDGFTGNYWDDYAGVDANDDGIGDTPYIVPGTAGSQDNFPIWTDGDDLAPVITIISPLLDSVFGLVAPNYSISIEELNLDTFWYTLDGGTTNYTITGLTGTLNQFAWYALSVGSVTIRFYANDTAGNLGFKEVSVQKALEYWVLSPFVIDDTGAGDFTWTQAATQGWCGGSGTQSNPYIIEYVIINGQNSGSCIVIRNSIVPFIIRNSVMSYSGSGEFDAGIKLNNVDNSLLYNITGSSNNNFGIILMDCLNNIITESNINDNGVGGILLYYSHSNSIIDNDQTIHNNGMYGILLNSSNYNIISGNYISNCQYGIYFYDSSENQITYNIFVGNDDHIEETAGSGNNNIDETNDIPSDEVPFPTELLIIISIIAIAAITSITVGIVVKKKLSQRTGTKLGRKMDKKQATIRKKLEKKMAFVDHLIKENKINIALKNLF